MWVVIIIFISALAAFLFHFTTLSSYERQADSIIQNSNFIPSYNEQLNPDNSTSQKLADLDKKYGFDFMVKPAIHNYDSSNNNHLIEKGYNNSDSDKGPNDKGFSNGDRMYYMVIIKIPYMSVGRTYVKSSDSYDGNQGVKLIHKASFNNAVPKKTICQTSNDNDNNNSPTNN